MIKSIGAFELQPLLRNWRTRPGSWRAAIGISILLVYVSFALFPAQIAPLDPSKQDLAHILQPPVWISGDRSHWLGTDQLGRDLWTRIVFSSGLALGLASSAVLASLLVGVSLGLLAGFFGGIQDRFITALSEVQLAFPFILLAITIVAATKPGVFTLILVMALSGWVVYARLIRSRVLTVRELEYIEAARATGATSRRILVRHVLPQVTGTVIVIATLELGRIIVLESTLSFLGLGVQPPNITWGEVLADGREYISSGWWIAMFSGLTIVLVVFAVYLLGDWLAERLDPTLAQ